MQQETKTTQFTRPEKAYYSTREFVEFIRDYSGMVVSAATVHKWTMLGIVPFQKARNKRLLFPVKAVKDWIDNGGVV